MKYGVAVFPTDEGVQPAVLAAAAEAAGFESLFVPEHSHIPASRESSFLPPGVELPREYSRVLEPFVALAAAAAATERLRLGTGIALVAQRDAIATAKQISSLDWVSGGRFLFGIGGGWNKEEARNHGADADRLFATMRDKVLAMKAIWASEEASYSGRYVEFERIWQWPKPVQRPHPPILIGGNGKRAIERVLEYGDEWLPEPEDGLPERIATLFARAREAGRPEIGVTVYGAEPDDVEMYAQAGVGRCVFWLPPDPAEATEAALAEFAARLPSLPR